MISESEAKQEEIIRNLYETNFGFEQRYYNINPKFALNRKQRENLLRISVK